MTNLDTTHRFLFERSDIRGEITKLQTSFEAAYAHQKFPRALRPLFGEFLVAVSLLSETLKFEGLLTIQAKGTDKVSLILAESDHKGNIRGIVRMHPDFESGEKAIFESNLSDLMGNGHLAITIDPEKGERYQGIVDIESANLAQALEGYFSNSEQLPTTIILNATEKQASGLFLQCLPPQNIMDEQERQEQWNTAKHLALTCSNDELHNLSQQELLYRLFNEMDCRIFEPKNIQFRCSCTRERSERALLSIGQNEAYELIRERDIININCEFCGKDYVFSSEDLDKLFSPNSSLH